MNSYDKFVPNVTVILTMPISVTSGERSFSELKIIKNYSITSWDSIKFQDDLDKLSIIPFPLKKKQLML